MAADREIFQGLKNDAGLKRFHDVWRSVFPGALWCLAPKNGARPRGSAARCFCLGAEARGKDLSRIERVLARAPRRAGQEAGPFYQRHSKDSGSLILPLRVGDRDLGFLALIDVRAETARHFQALFSHSLKLLLDDFWKTTELARLSATIRPRAIALSTVHTVHRIINSTLNLNELVSRLGHLTAQVLRVHRCAIRLIDTAQKKDPGAPAAANKKGRLLCKALVGYPKTGRHERPIPIGQGLEGRVAKTADIQLRKKVLCVPLIDEDVIGVLTVSAKKDKKDFNSFDLEILTTLAEEAVIAIKNAQLYEEQRRVTLNTIQSLAMVLGSRLPQQAVVLSPEAFAKLALHTAEALGLSEEQTQALHYAALLKETTKIGIPQEILTKTTKLTGEELSALHRHTIHGAKIVQNFESLKTVAPIILYSREKFDGTGYPEGLKGEAIPIGARILSVMNAFEAIVIGRPYRGRSSQDEALSELQRNSGSQFDPKVVEAFVRIMKKEGFHARLKHAGS